MMKYILPSFLILLISVSFAQARSFEIAATVNTDAISMVDVDERLRLFFISSGMPPTEENQQKGRQQVLDVLIEEQLKIQEAERNNIEITPEEIEEGFMALAQQNNLESEQFEQALGQQGIPKDTLLKQIKSQIAWTKVVQSVLRPRINVSENDIDARMDQMKKGMGSDEYFASEIFLPVQSDDDEEKMMDLAQKLSDEIQKGGARFSLVAAQFSKAQSAAQGGQMGWVSEEEIPKELALVLRTMEVGTISPPVRGLSGITILGLQDKRVKSEESLPSEEDTLNAIGLERLDRAQQRHLSDLKAAALIERRL
ncbi:MAG: peptidylprolyl isomerase [Pseudomonadota bacterium]